MRDTLSKKRDIKSRLWSYDVKSTQMSETMMRRKGGIRKNGKIFLSFLSDSFIVRIYISSSNLLIYFHSNHSNITPTNPTPCFHNKRLLNRFPIWRLSLLAVYREERTSVKMYKIKIKEGRKKPFNCFSTLITFIWVSIKWKLNVLYPWVFGERMWGDDDDDGKDLINYNFIATDCCRHSLSLLSEVASLFYWVFFNSSPTNFDITYILDWMTRLTDDDEVY